MMKQLQDQSGKTFILHETGKGTKFNMAAYVYPAGDASEGIQVFYEETGGERGSLRYANRITFKNKAEFLAHVEEVLDAAGFA